MSGAVPNLRFPGFEGGWSIANFGDLTTIAKGQVDPKIEPFASMPHIAPDNIESKTGNIRNVRTARQDGVFSGKYAFDERAIVYSKIRPNLNKVAKPNMVGICSADMYPIWGIDGHLDTDYLLQVMRGESFVSAATAVSMRTGLPKINRPDLNSIPVPLPTSLPEQQKIADFLGTVDAKLDMLRRKKSGLERFRSGLIQRLFSQELRFTRDDGSEFPAWEEIPLNVAFVEIRTPVGNRKIPTYSISAGRGFVSQEERFGKDISGQQNERYVALAEGEFSYNKGNSISYKYGCIYENKTGHTIAVPNVFISFKLRDTRMSAGYFGKLFESHYLDRGLRTLISSGARMNGLLNVNKDAFFALSVPIPHPDEQRKIADALSVMDAKVAAVADQITHMETFKKGLLQQMFV